MNATDIDVGRFVQAPLRGRARRPRQCATLSSAIRFLHAADLVYQFGSTRDREERRSDIFHVAVPLSCVEIAEIFFMCGSM